MRWRAGREGQEGSHGSPSPERPGIDLTARRTIKLSGQPWHLDQAAVAERFTMAAHHQGAFEDLLRQGRLEEALVEATKVTAFYREVTQCCPEPYFRCELARSLLSEHECLFRLHQRDGLLEVASEAANITAEVAEVDFAGFSGDFGNALTALYADFKLLGRHQEALTIAAGFITHWYRMERAGLQPGRDRLACALSNESEMLEALGRHDEALIAATEAVAIQREVADANPGENRFSLATALNCLAGHLGRARRHQEALDATTEALVLCRGLVAGKGLGGRESVARAHANQSAYLDSLGRHDEALVAITEAVGIFRELAEVQPEQACEGLAAWLTNQGKYLGALGRHEDAIGPLTEAVSLFGRLTPLGRNWHLVLPLRILGAELDHLGRGREADEVRARAQVLPSSAGLGCG